MHECDEVALTMPTNGIHTLDDARQIVRNWMGDESEQVIDNVAESLYRRAKQVRQ